jgi:hypothetical protein
MWHGFIEGVVSELSGLLPWKVQLGCLAGLIAIVGLAAFVAWLATLAGW